MKIKRISLWLPMEGSCWEVGESIFTCNDDKKVTEIKNLTSEFPDSIDRQYDIYVEGKLYKSLVNVPVVITYFAED